jgi:CRISPR-associated endoribonuclease Cas6
VPVEITLRVTPLQKVRLRPYQSPAQGFFLALIRSIDPDWSQALHDGQSVPDSGMRRPAYTVAPLHFAPRTEGEHPTLLHLAEEWLRAGETVCVRVGLASDIEGARLLQALTRLTDLPRLGGAPCRLERIPRPLPDDPDVLHFDWQVLAEVPAARRLRFDFLTPTTFKSQGQYIPRCEPERLWASWAQAWKAFAPKSLCDALCPAQITDIILPHLAAYDLHTETFAIEKDTITGFVGWAEFTFRPGAPEADRHKASALATVADFLGTGAKCSMGLGQTRCTLLDTDAP